ncbi:MAG: hypothetical protein H0U52_12870 [Chloroflexi bacterium]|nr:hypothetical protein [Chloroflexota bacterium]
MHSQMPYPALLFPRHWDIADANLSGRMMFASPSGAVPPDPDPLRGRRAQPPHRDRRAGYGTGRRAERPPPRALLPRGPGDRTLIRGPRQPALKPERLRNSDSVRVRRGAGTHSIERSEPAAVRRACLRRATRRV